MRVPLRPQTKTGSKKERWIVYLVRCCDDSLYCGVTNDLAARLDKHHKGQGAKYTRSRLPVRLVYAEWVKGRGEALRREYQIKGLTKRMKERLCRSWDKRTGSTVSPRQRIIGFGKGYHPERPATE